MGNRETGYPGTLTPPDPVCPVCNGAGWLMRRAPVNSPDYGRILPCGCQESPADRDRRAAALERYSNLGPLRRATFDAANPNGPGGGRAGTATGGRAFAAALDTARAYAENPDGWLTFVGPSGSGKTWLAAAIANHCIHAGRPALFITAADLLDYLRGGFDDDAEVSFVDLFEQVRNAELLALDDLPTRPATPWGQERLTQLLAWRHSARLPTVVTLRGDPNRLDDFLRTRLESPDGFGRMCRLGRIRSADGLAIGTIPAGMRRRMTFQAFNPNGHGGLSRDDTESLTRARNYIQHWVENPESWLNLFGPMGVGKTHLAVAAAAERENRGDEVFFATVPDLLDYLRATFSPNSPIAHYDVLERIKTCDLLVLDNMGAERNTPFAEDKLLQIAGYRYDERLPTIITSNKEPDDVAASRPEIASRMQDPLVVFEVIMVAPDYRLGGAFR